MYAQWTHSLLILSRYFITFWLMSLEIQSVFVIGRERERVEGGERGSEGQREREEGGGERK